MANYNSDTLAHINMMQDIIKRMANNSASSKQWCILILSAILTFAAKKENLKIDLSMVCLFPIVTFCFLDSYYLSLERKFRNEFDNFVKKVNGGHSMDSFLFIVGPLKCSDNYTFCDKAEESVKISLCQLWQTVKCLFSFSIFPFYLGMYLFIKYVVTF